MHHKLAVFCSVMFVFGSAYAKELHILTTTTTLAAIISPIAGSRSKVVSLLQGQQDPHYIEAKPSFMVQARNVDLLVSVGLDLESAWLDKVVSGSRNQKIQKNSPGSLRLGEHTNPIDKQKGPVDRSMGDIHPEGNPHFYLDPSRVIALLAVIESRLSQLDPEGHAQYAANRISFEKELASNLSSWSARIKASGVRKVITYHKTLDYFLLAFGIENAGYVETKPGIPPTAKHLIELSSQIKTNAIGCFMIESFFDPTPAEKLAKEHRATMQRVATEVGALPKTETYVQLIERLVASVETCRRETT